MEEFKFRYTDNDRYIYFSLFFCFLSLVFLLSTVYVGKIISNNRISDIIILLCLIISFLLFLGVPAFLIITYKKTEKRGIALFEDNCIELLLTNKKYSIKYDEIKNIKLNENQVRHGKYVVWFYVYILNIITKNKQIKIKASIEESKEIHENGSNVSLKILYNKLYDIMKEKNNGT